MSPIPVMHVETVTLKREGETCMSSTSADMWWHSCAGQKRGQSKEGEVHRCNLQLTAPLQSGHDGRLMLAPSDQGGCEVVT
jgi:hypothetical protein